MSLPLNKRDYDAFLSYAHTDRPFVEKLYRWLQESAGLEVWWDDRDMSAGALLATELQKAIERCRAVVLVASDDSISRGWVQAEYNAAYVIASWHQDDNVSARATCAYLVEQGFRLIGDSPDQKGFGSGDRVQRIVNSCGAFVAIVPYRGTETAVTGQRPYKYFLQEIDFAAEQELPSVIIADPRIRRADGHDQHWLRMETNESIVPDPVQLLLRSLWDKWQQPRHPHYVFCAMDLDSEDTRFTGPVRQLIQRITSMPTIVGSEVHGGNSDNVNAAVRRAVCEAFLVIADLTEDNINACIEAGMALAVGTNVELLAAGPQRRPPFMLRERNMPTYTDKVQQIGLIHRISRAYRRRVINAEF